MFDAEMFEGWMKRGGQVQRFQKPEYHFVRNTGGLYGKDFTELSDDSKRKNTGSVRSLFSGRSQESTPSFRWARKGYLQIR